jgi:hypothetical protein
MSVKHKENRSVNLDMPLVLRSLDERTKFGLNFLFESGNNLGTVKEDCFLKKRIDKLNSKFYTETEKYMNYKLELERSNEKLFSLLVKEIGLYIEEIDRLNAIANRKTENDKEVKNLSKKSRKKIKFLITIFTLKIQYKF